MSLFTYDIPHLFLSFWCLALYKQSLAADENLGSCCSNGAYMAADRAPVRLSKIAGRYLVFDLDDVMYLRRRYNICAVFTGTIPQAPSQNVFMSLPIELICRRGKVAGRQESCFHVADDPAAQLSQLRSMDDAARKAYIQTLTTHRKMKSQAIQQERGERAAKGAELADKRRSKKLKAIPPDSSKVDESPGRAMPEARSSPEEDFFDAAPTMPPKTLPQLVTRMMHCPLHQLRVRAFSTLTTNQVAIEVPKTYTTLCIAQLSGLFYHTRPQVRRRLSVSTLATHFATMRIF